MRSHSYESFGVDSIHPFSYSFILYSCSKRFNHNFDHHFLPTFNVFLFRQAAAWYASVGHFNLVLFCQLLCGKDKCNPFFLKETPVYVHIAAQVGEGN